MHSGTAFMCANVVATSCSVQQQTASSWLAQIVRMEPMQASCLVFAVMNITATPIMQESVQNVLIPTVRNVCIAAPHVSGLYVSSINHTALMSSNVSMSQILITRC